MCRYISMSAVLSPAWKAMANMHGWPAPSVAGFDALYIMTTAMLGSTVCLFWSFMSLGWLQDVSRFVWGNVAVSWYPIFWLKMQAGASRLMTCRHSLKLCLVEAADDGPSHDRILFEWIPGSVLRWSKQTSNLEWMGSISLNSMVQDCFSIPKKHGTECKRCIQ